MRILWHSLDTKQTRMMGQTVKKSLMIRDYVCDDTGARGVSDDTGSQMMICNFVWPIRNVSVPVSLNLICFG